MSLVFNFGQGLRCGLSIRHCRCHWIMVAWFVSCTCSLILCAGTLSPSERQMWLFFCGRLSWSHGRQTSLSKGFLLLLPWLYRWILFSFYLPMSMLFQNKNNYSRLLINWTFANSNQNRFPLDFRHTFPVISPAVTRTLDCSNSRWLEPIFVSPQVIFYTILPSIARTMFWALEKSHHGALHSRSKVWSRTTPLYIKIYFLLCYIKIIPF